MQFARQRYDPLIDVGQEREHYRTVFDALWPHYCAGMLQVIALKDANRNEAAAALFGAASQSLFSDLQAFMRWDLGYNHAAGVAAGHRAHDVDEGARHMVAVGIACALLACGLTSLLLTRHSVRRCRR